MHSGDGRQKQLFGEEAFNALVLPDPSTGKPLMTPDEALEALRYARETFAPNFMPGF